MVVQVEMVRLRWLWMHAVGRRLRGDIIGMHGRLLGGEEPLLEELNPPWVDLRRVMYRAVIAHSFHLFRLWLNFKRYNMIFVRRCCVYCC